MAAKASKVSSGSAERGSVPAAARRRSRGHSLAPGHLGEAGSVAMLALAILGLSVFIAGVAMVAAGLTMAGRYAGTTPPPNITDLGRGQVFGGFGLVGLAVLQVGSALALLGAVRGARRLAMLVAVASAVLGVAGVALVVSQEITTSLLVGALVVATLIYAASAIVLARPRR